MALLPLSMEVQSFVDMDLERAVAVARAFDEHASLRPRRVGGDPARIKVEPSLAAVVARQGLPIEWFTVRGTTPKFELGEIELLQGRGGYTGDNLSGRWKYILTGHSVKQTWWAEEADFGALAREVADLFESVVQRLDAAYGYVAAGRGDRVHITAYLAGPHWLNYFGLALADAAPKLASLPGARTLPTRGVLVRLGDLPGDHDAVAAGKARLVELFGPSAYHFRNSNRALPTVQQHLQATPGTEEMPWITHQRQRDDGRRQKRFQKAITDLADGLAARPEPPLAGDAVAWGSNLDLEDWKRLEPRLRRRVRGELGGPLGTALRAAMANAPLDYEMAVVLNTDAGPLQIAWFADDIDVLDVELCGSPAVVEFWSRLFLDE